MAGDPFEGRKIFTVESENASLPLVRAIVMDLALLRDAAGSPNGSAVVSRMAAAAPVPVFSIVEAPIGQGAIAGLGVVQSNVADLGVAFAKFAGFVHRRRPRGTGLPAEIHPLPANGPLEPTDPAVSDIAKALVTHPKP